MSTDLEARLAGLQSELHELRADYNNYTYTVSHDLAAPFRQIEGFSSIILEKHREQFDEKSRRHLELIMKGAQNGSAMVESLLVYSRICSATMEISRIDCNAIVADVLEELLPLMQESNSEFSCGQLPVVEGDATQVKTIFHHVIHNALLYHKPGSNPAIEIESEEDENEWKFCIRDNGIGIPEKQLNKVFMVLRRAVLPKDYPGQGMGLAIAKRIVEQHQGTISIEENEGGGCAVHFSFRKPSDKSL